MDPSLVLEQTLQDISNLPAELHHLLEEIKNTDIELYDQRKKYLQKDGQLQKFIAQNGSLVAPPNEAELSQKITKEICDCQEVQDNKCTMANTALFLVSKHLSKLEKSIELLEEQGLLAALQEDAGSGTELSRESSVLSNVPEKKRKPTSVEPSSIPSMKKRKLKRQQQLAEQSRQKSREPSGSTYKVDGNSNNSFPLQDELNEDLLFNFPNNDEEDEEEDKTLYCFCQRQSYGEMVACDGPNCKYEWFHYSCVNLKEPPKGTWYCPDCTQELAKNRLKKKRGVA